jgi:hypothetical protein
MLLTSKANQYVGSVGGGGGNLNHESRMVCNGTASEPSVVILDQLVKS